MRSKIRFCLRITQISQIANKGRNKGMVLLKPLC